jgi:excisionase family DNA binding protein
VTRDDLLAAVRDADLETLPGWIGALAEALALAMARLMVRQGTLTQCAETALSPGAVAARLDLPPSKVYHLLRSGSLRGAKVGKYWRVPPAELTTYLKQRAR